MNLQSKTELKCKKNARCDGKDNTKKLRDSISTAVPQK